MTYTPYCNLHDSWLDAGCARESVGLYVENVVGRRTEKHGIQRSQKLASARSGFEKPLELSW